MSIRLKINNY